MVCRAEKIIRLAPKMRTCIHQYRRVRLFGTNRIILSALEFMATLCRRERIYPFRYVIFCGMHKCIIPYNTLSSLRYNQRVEEIAVDCRFEQRRRTGVLRAVKNGEIR